MPGDGFMVWGQSAMANRTKALIDSVVDAYLRQPTARKELNVLDSYSELSAGLV